MSEDLIIELQSRMLGLKRMELSRFGEEMKWIKVEEIGEKGMPETKRVEKVTEQTPILHTPEDSESVSEGDEGLSLPPNEMDEVVQSSLRPESVNDATVDPSTNGDINQSREVPGNENDANRLNIQVEETMETPGDVEETPPQSVRPPLRFGYNAPGCPTGEFPFIWQDPNVG
jgi:hypothetical protein